MIDFKKYCFWQIKIYITYRCDILTNIFFAIFRKHFQFTFLCNSPCFHKLKKKCLLFSPILFRKAVICLNQVQTSVQSILILPPRAIPFSFLPVRRMLIMCSVRREASRLLRLRRSSFPRLDCECGISRDLSSVACLLSVSYRNLLFHNVFFIF